MKGGVAESLTLLEAEALAVKTLRVGRGEAACVSVRSPVRETPNEDGALAIGLDGERGLLAVADGAGGLPLGGRAARLAIEALSAAVRRAPPGPLVSPILAGFERGNAEVIELRVGAATTLVAVEIAGDEVRTVHVGDSGALVVGQRGRVKLQTVPHSPTGYGVEAGLIEPREALHHDDLALVLNLLGSADMRIELGSALRLARRDTVLVASDGLFDNLHLEEIVELIRCGPLARAARRLADTALARMHDPQPGQPSKPDDLTFVLYRLRA